MDLILLIIMLVVCLYFWKKHLIPQFQAEAYYRQLLIEKTRLQIQIMKRDIDDKLSSNARE